MPVHVEEDEKLVRIINEHWIKYARPFFVALLILLLSALSFFLWLKGPSVISGYLDVLYILFLILVLAVFHWLFLIFFSDATSMVILTNKRVIYINQLLFLQESMDEVSFNMIRYARSETEGLLHNLLKYGNVIFDTGLRISRIPHPNLLVKEIEQMAGMR